jgi:uncharacterized membrane protein
MKKIMPVFFIIIIIAVIVLSVVLINKYNTLKTPTLDGTASRIVQQIGGRSLSN